MSIDTTAHTSRALAGDRLPRVCGLDISHTQRGQHPGTPLHMDLGGDVRALNERTARRALAHGVRCVVIRSPLGETDDPLVPAHPFAHFRREFRGREGMDVRRSAVVEALTEPYIDHLVWPIFYIGAAGTERERRAQRWFWGFVARRLAVLAPAFGFPAGTTMLPCLSFDYANTDPVRRDLCAELVEEGLGESVEDWNRTDVPEDGGRVVGTSDIDTREPPERTTTGFAGLEHLRLANEAQRSANPTRRERRLYPGGFRDGPRFSMEQELARGRRPLALIMKRETDIVDMLRRGYAVAPGIATDTPRWHATELMTAAFPPKPTHDQVPGGVPGVPGTGGDADGPAGKGSRA